MDILVRFIVGPKNTQSQSEGLNTEVRLVESRDSSCENINWVYFPDGF